jgi:hypothetical protein
MFHLTLAQLHKLFIFIVVIRINFDLANLSHVKDFDSRYVEVVSPDDQSTQRKIEDDEGS